MIDRLIDSAPCDRRRSDRNLQYVPVRHRRGSYQAGCFKIEVRGVCEPEEKHRVRKIRALTICMENPEIPWRIQMERFIPVEIFRKKVIPFEVLPCPRFHQNDRNFLYHLFGLQSVLSEQESTKGIAFIRNEARACGEIIEIKTKPSKKPRQQQAFNCKKLEQNICRCPAFGRLCFAKRKTTTPKCVHKRILPSTWLIQASMPPVMDKSSRRNYLSSFPICLLLLVACFQFAWNNS